MNTLIQPAAGFAQPILYVEARFYRKGPRRCKPLWMVIHATHGAEGRGKARDGALELAQLPDDARKRSPHAIIDTSQIVQCVPWDCEAYHCGQTGNRYGEGVELCGMADQTTAQWFDAASLPMLQLAASFVRWRCDVRGIPLEWVTRDELREHKSGITSHAEISRAFRESNHWDPGPSFPITAFVEAVRLAQPAVPSSLRRDS